MDLVESFRVQATACRQLGSPMYGELLDVLTDDYEAGGPSVEVLRRHENDPGPSALGLRLMGSIHRLVLTGRAPELATFYPSVGGTYVPAAADVALLRLLGDEPDAVREWLEHQVQTNEVGRSSALYGGLLQLPWRLPVRLFEMGASGGLNLMPDKFAYVTRDGVLGQVDSPVRLDPAWHHGPAERQVEIVERVGSDAFPVDVRSDEGRLTLTAYVWPDQASRLARLRGALELSSATPLVVAEEDAVSFVRRIQPEEGTATVLWHSVMLQYLSAEDREQVIAGIEALGAAATERSPFAHLSLEPTRRTPDSEHEFLVMLQTWPSTSDERVGSAATLPSAGKGKVLGKAAPHGLPVTWD